MSMMDEENKKKIMMNQMNMYNMYINMYMNQMKMMNPGLINNTNQINKMNQINMMNPNFINNMNQINMMNPNFMTNMNQINMMNPNFINSMNQINMINNQNLMTNCNPYMQQMNMMNIANYNKINQMQIGNMPMTKEEQEKFKREQRIQGYLLGKEYARMLKEQEQKGKEKSEKPQNDSSNNNKNSTTKDTKDASDAEKTENNKITIKFNKGGTITEIEIGSDAGVFELINEYFTKSNTQSGTFKFKENNLLPTDISELNEIGLKNGDEIMVS
jgi:hypothetical protein